MLYTLENDRCNEILGVINQDNFRKYTVWVLFPQIPQLALLLPPVNHPPLFHGMRALSRCRTTRKYTASSRLTATNPSKERVTNKMKTLPLLTGNVIKKHVGAEIYDKDAYNNSIFYCTPRTQVFYNSYISHTPTSVGVLREIDVAGNFFHMYQQTTDTSFHRKKTREIQNLALL